MWKATSKPKTEEILGLTLPKPGITIWNSLFAGIEKAQDKYLKLKEDLNLSASSLMNSSVFLYLQEYLACSQPIVEALDILPGEEYTFSRIEIPTVVSLQRKLENLM